MENTSAYKGITKDHEDFYVLANKKNYRLGHFLFKVNTTRAMEGCEYLVDWPTRL